MGNEPVVHELAAEGIGRGCGDDRFIQVEERGRAGGAVSGKRGTGHRGRPAVCVRVTLLIVTS